MPSAKRTSEIRGSSLQLGKAGIFDRPWYEESDPFEPGPVIVCDGLFDPHSYSNRFKELLNEQKNKRSHAADQANEAAGRKQSEES